VAKLSTEYQWLRSTEPPRISYPGTSKLNDKGLPTADFALNSEQRFAAAYCSVYGYCMDIPSIIEDCP
jgi:hypothetical protein